MFVAHVLLDSPKLPDVDAFKSELLKYAPKLEIKDVQGDEEGLAFNLPGLGVAYVKLENSPVEDELAEIGVFSSLERYYGEEDSETNTEHAAHLLVALEVENEILDEASFSEQCDFLTLLAKFCLAAVDTTPAVAVNFPDSDVTHSLDFFREQMSDLDGGDDPESADDDEESFPYMVFIGLMIGKLDEEILAAESPRRPHLAVHSSGLELLGLRELIIRTSEEMLDEAIPLFHDAVVSCIESEETPEDGDIYSDADEVEFEVTHEESMMDPDLPVWSIVLK